MHWSEGDGEEAGGREKGRIGFTMNMVLGARANVYEGYESDMVDRTVLGNNL